MRLKTTLVACAIVSLLLACQASATPLDDYVNKPDSSYKWHLAGQLTRNGFTAYFINMTSQTWLTPEDTNRPVWWHWLTICVPDRIAGFDTSIIYIDGGSNNEGLPSDIDPLTEVLCVSSGLVTGHLEQIPNQPVVFYSDPLKKSRSEDAVIAFTWAHFLNDTSDPEWLLRLPMTKAVVRAMDTIQAFTANMPNVPRINGFGIAGASKRGWTTWTTAAVDNRVKVFIPIVIPILDIVPNMNRLYQPYGSWSFALKDYIDAGILGYLNKPQMQALAAVVDPFTYNSRYANRPHYIIAAGGDEFFLPDSANVFYSRLTGPKFLRVVPDAEHSLVGQQLDVALCAETFIQMYLHNEPGPIFNWKISYGNLTGSITVNIPEKQPGSAKLKGVYMWYTNTLSNTQRDFRLIVCGELDKKCINPVLWFYETLQPTSPGVYTVSQTAPLWGWRAFLIEAVFTFDWPEDVLNPTRELRLTTEVNVVPNKMPFPPCGNDCNPKKPMKH